MSILEEARKAKKEAARNAEIAKRKRTVVVINNPNNSGKTKKNDEKSREDR